MYMSAPRALIRKSKQPKVCNISFSSFILWLAKKKYLLWIQIANKRPQKAVPFQPKAWQKGGKKDKNQTTFQQAKKTIIASTMGLNLKAF